MIDSLTLGTANLGMAYGATNSKTYLEESSRSVLELALSKGIRNFDTAPGYGSAEMLLGDVGSKIEGLNVVTKIPKLAEYTFDSVMVSIQESLRKLGVAQLHGILFHDPEILNNKFEISLTDRILGTNLVRRVGFSAYREVEIKEAKDVHPNWSIFQIPENILNRTSYNSKELMELHRNGDQIMVRSIFLQGLLTQQIDKIETKFRDLIPAIEKIQIEANKLNLSTLDFCLSYAQSIPWSSGTIVAAADCKQLEEILNFEYAEIDFSKYVQVSPSKLDPRNWV